MDRRVAHSLLAFWADSGVDTVFEETAVDRMSRAAERRPVRAPIQVATTLQPIGPIAGGDEQAREAARAAGDLKQLGDAVAAYDGCALKQAGARQAVFYRGSADAPVFVVGEGPGAEEDLQGAPFVGRAGRLLDLMLAAAGLEGRVFITNSVFWRPPGNRTPTADEQRACAPFVERAIELVKPRILLLVGAASSKFMLQRTEGILSLRGRWFEWRGHDSEAPLPAMPTLHPAFLLRQPSAKKLAWRDLLILSERLDRGDRPD